MVFFTAGCFAAALLLGASRAVGTDTDPLAVRAAAANAELNGLQDRLQLVQCGASLSDPDPLLLVRGLSYALLHEAC